MSRRSNHKIPKQILNQLKREIISKLGKDIVNKTDCYDLSEAIFMDTGKLINYNTLRRFFGLIKSSEVQINSTSLDILANYCGYNSFSFYINKKPKLDTNELNERFLELIDKSKFNFESVEDMCVKYGMYSQIYPFLEKVLVIAFNYKSISFFKMFYELPNVFEIKPFNMKDIYDLAMLYARLLNMLDSKERESIIKQIINIGNARAFFFEYYVDLDNINNGFGNILELYFEKSKTVEAKAFYYSLKIFQAFLCSNKEQLKVIKGNLDILKFEENKLHPFLRGRLVANSIYKNGKLCQTELDKIKQVIGELKNNPTLLSQLFLIPILQAIQLNEDVNGIKTVFESLPKKVFQVGDFLTDNASNHLKIYLAHYYVLTKESVKALATISQIEPNRFPKFEEKLQNLSYQLMLKDYYILENMSEQIKKSNLEINDLKLYLYELKADQLCHLT